MRNKYSKYTDPDKFVSDPGSDVHELYSGRLTATGEIILTPSGKESISEKINAQKEFTDIAYIRHRLEMGDTSMLRTDIQYGDFSQGPKTLAEHLQVFIDARKAFDNLDLDTRNSFNNNYMNWLQTAGTDPWTEKMSKYLPQKEEIVEKEIAVDES